MEQTITTSALQNNHRTVLHYGKAKRKKQDAMKLKYKLNPLMTYLLSQIIHMYPKLPIK